MALEIKLNQKLSQSLVMTPQLQQAIKLLQLGRHEYLEMLQKELLENPVLEDERGNSLDANGSNEEGTRRSDELNGTETPSTDEVSDSLYNDGSISSDNDFFQQTFLSETRDQQKTTNSDDTDWREYFDTHSDSFQFTTGGASRYSDDEERPTFESTVSKPEGLTTHLYLQLRTTELWTDDEEIAIQIIGNLDRSGYLRATVEEISKVCRRSIEDVERVLAIVQTLDPPGVGARDLRECLSVQLEQLGLTDSLTYRLVRKHLEKLETRRYELIAKEENVSVEEVYEAVKVIQRLEPRPGRPFLDEPPVYVTPDIYVRKVGEEYVISLNEAGIPKLRLNSQYRELLENGHVESAENKEYIQDRLRSAAWLIKSIHQRQQTIYRVTESIMKFQKEFLDEGVKALRPLVLRDVASDVGMHESTVSRVTNNKYVHTPQGIYELKYFFSSGLKSQEGEISSESVKDKIRALIAGEDPRKPLSDQSIVETLKADGIDIARRTVAKYREMIGILSSSRRKKIF